MELIIISEIEGEKSKIDDFVMRLKNQYFTNFLVYMVYNREDNKLRNYLSESINEDRRFVLIGNDNGSPKTKYLNEILRGNKKLRWDDVIIDLNMGSEITDNLVLGLINKTFMDRNILCSNVVMNNDLTKSENLNYEQSNIKMFRKVLFEFIGEDNLIYDNNYIGNESNIAIYKPIIEMCGSKRHVILHDIVLNNPSVSHNYNDDKIVKYLKSKNKYGEIEIQMSNQKDNKINRVDINKVETTKLNDQNQTQKTLTDKDKKINYDKINSLFGNTNSKVIKKLINEPTPHKIKLNYDTISKLNIQKKRR